MQRTVMFYGAAVLGLGTLAYLIARAAWGPDAGAPWWEAWSGIVAVVGLFLLLVHAPIAWLAAALARPWLAYPGAALVVPAIMLLKVRDFTGEWTLDPAALAREAGQEAGFYASALLVGLLFTAAYVRWMAPRLRSRTAA